MTRKDYEKIAETLKNSLPRAPKTGYDPLLDLKLELVNRFITMLEQDNPRFDADKFLKACGF